MQYAHFWPVPESGASGARAFLGITQWCEPRDIGTARHRRTNLLVARRYETLGPEAVGRLFFANHRAHTTRAGADLIAEIAVEALRALPGTAFDKYLLTKQN